MVFVIVTRIKLGQNLKLIFANLFRVSIYLNPQTDEYNCQQKNHKHNEEKPFCKRKHL